MDVLFLINTVEGINVWRRAILLKTLLEHYGELEVKLIARRESKLNDFFRFYRLVLFQLG